MSHGATITIEDLAREVPGPSGSRCSSIAIAA